jgi:septal ring factor EnvC (AmiA/AmiB activator)
MRDLKQEVSEERERIREKNREQDTLLIKAESKVAVLDEQLKALKAELAVNQKKIEELQSNEAK